MRVKVGDQWYDSKYQPVAIEVSEKEQEQIAGLDRTIAPKGRFAKESTGMTTEDFVNWLQECDDER